MPRPVPETAEVLVADIGSTLTKLSAFAGLEGVGRPRFVGQGVSLTTVTQGDVTVGLERARADLERRYAVVTSGTPLMAASSAAGGLGMTVHGLTRDMTLRAGREAALGAGAIIRFATAGLMSEADLDRIRQVRPKLILLTGGVDDGDRDVVLANARRLARLGEPIPVIYAGNVAVREEAVAILERAGLPVDATDNVYPRLDQLRVDAVRELIQILFARHIVTAPGMDKLKAVVSGRILPTPAAVMQATELCAERVGDVMTVDVGGATTDVHSVTDGAIRYRGLGVAPEPRSKRTVEGDLGVYINATHVLEAANLALPNVDQVEPMPTRPETRRLARELTRLAVDTAVWRHAGSLHPGYHGLGGPSAGEWIEGRDLTAIGCIVGTGGALTRLDEGEAILRHIRRDPTRRKLLPLEHVKVVLDRQYIMAAAGVLSQREPKAARVIIADSLGLSNTGH